MACQTRERAGFCTHAQCPYPDETTHGFQCVEISFATNLCEMGENCLTKCPHSFTDQTVKPCPECAGKPGEYAVCSTCGDLGIVRK